MVLEILAQDSAAMLMAVQQAMRPSKPRQAAAPARTAEVAHVVETGQPDMIKLFFVRVPRPLAADNTNIKQLTADFAVHVEAVNAVNSSLGAKREVLRGVRGQMSEARSLRDASQPAYDEKLNRIKQLRELRDDHRAGIAEIRDLVKGLDCKSEQELVAKIQQHEQKIRNGEASTLREERHMVLEIGRLNGSREKVRQWEQRKASLEQLQDELKKVMAAIEEADVEFAIIKGERDAAAKIASDIHARVKALEKDLEATEERQRAAVEKKNEVLAKLQAAKQEREGSSTEYNENRKFSLLIREMVDKGQVDEAREMCAKQVDTLMTKLSSDPAFRAAYTKSLAEQRKSAVSILLPESSTAAAAAQPPQPTAAGKPAPAPVPQPPVAKGKEKAKELIATIMQQASAEAALVKASLEDAECDVESDHDEQRGTGLKTEEASKAPPASNPIAAAPPPPSKFVENPAAKAAEVFNFKMDVLKVQDVEVVPLPARPEAVTMSKEEVREEQRLKSLDAEARKKKRQETTDKKKAKAIVMMQKRAEDDEQGLAAKHAAMQAVPVEPMQEAEPVPVCDVEGSREPCVAADAPAAAVRARPTVPQLTAAAKLVAPAAKRPAVKANVLQKLRRLYQQNTVLLVVLAVIALIMAMLML